MKGKSKNWEVLRIAKSLDVKPQFSLMNISEILIIILVIHKEWTEPADRSFFAHTVLCILMCNSDVVKQKNKQTNKPSKENNPPPKKNTHTKKSINKT